MLEYFLIGLLLVVVTVAIHATGTIYWMRIVGKRVGRDCDSWEMRYHWEVFLWTAIVLIALHAVEVVVWSLTYLWIPSIEILKTFEQSIYFSLVTFTTLGYGDITLQPGPRLLSGIEAMNGILLFGWSTAFFFSVFQRSWKTIHSSKQRTGGNEAS